MLNIIKINVNIVENIIYMHVVARETSCWFMLYISCKQNVPNQ